MRSAESTRAVVAPAWHRELSGSLGICSQFVLEGNVQDRYLLPRGSELRPVSGIVDAVWDALAGARYEALVVFDRSGGLRLYAPTPVSDEAVRGALGMALTETGTPVSLERLTELMAQIVDGERAIALVVERAGRIAQSPSSMSEEELVLFREAERLALSAATLPARSGRHVGLFNPVIWVVDSDRELPGWLVGRSDFVRSIPIPLPDYGDRERYAGMLLSRLAGWDEASEDDRATFVARFTQQTEGMTLTALFSITLLADDTGVGLTGIDDAARAYRVGIVDSPWRSGYLRERLTDGDERIGRRVLGQRDAIRKSLDIMVRSATGLTGAHSSPYGTRPRGVLFFAGPTGVGKTELAKQLTELIFGDEQAYVRFDMSEFSEEHTAARLIGAPPGYVGYDAGGELTNAMRRRPFSLVLFDEIEKAHGRILDKFLQVLEDGRLTDGRGGTVFFSEAVLVFTSNLGIWVEGPDGRREPNVTAEDEPEAAERKILAAIKDHFTRVLGRPELLNRLGDNIVVFDFIKEETGRRILDLLIANVAKRVQREHEATLVLDEVAHGQLADAALVNLENGGRGIGSVVENALVNPLARAVFAHPPQPGGTVHVAAIRRSGRTYELDLV